MSDRQSHLLRKSWSLGEHSQERDMLSLSLMPGVRNGAWGWADCQADPVCWLLGFGIHPSELFPR